MAITTFDGLIAGLKPATHFSKIYSGAAQADKCKTTYYHSGFPTAGVSTSTGAAGEVQTYSTTPTGYFNFTNPASGETRLARATYQFGTAAGQLPWGSLLIDRLWRFGSSAGTGSPLDRTLTTAQAISAFTLPARDANGSTNGEGVYAALEVQTTMGTGVPTVTLTYTNSAGVGSRTATTTHTVAASAAAGIVMFFGLQAGDTGIRSIQSIQFSATWGTAGVLFLTLYRPIAYLTQEACPTFSLTSVRDSEAIQLAAPKIYDDSCLTIYDIQTTAATPVACGGMLQFSQG